MHEDNHYAFAEVAIQLSTFLFTGHRCFISHFLITSYSEWWPWIPSHLALLSHLLPRQNSLMPPSPAPGRLSVQSFNSVCFKLRDCYSFPGLFSELQSFLQCSKYVIDLGPNFRGIIHRIKWPCAKVSTSSTPSSSSPSNFPWQSGVTDSLSKNTATTLVCSLLLTHSSVQLSALSLAV